MNQWVRSRNGMVAGVFDGLGKSYGINPILLRLLWISSVCLFGFGVLLYLILAVLMPAEGTEREYYDKSMLLGVCRRISQQWGHDLVLVRLLFFGAFLISGGTMMIVYLIMHFLMPEDKTYHRVEVVDCPYSRR